MTEKESLLEYCERAVKNCVEECGGACSLRIKECECLDANVLKHLKELQQYRAIGTIEEFKALKEKATPKKPIYSDFDENEDGKIIPYKATCPICGHEFEFGTWNDEQNHHCVCDQKMDWEGGE